MATLAPLTPSQIAYLAEVLPPPPDRSDLPHRTRCRCLQCRARHAIRRKTKEARYRERRRAGLVGAHCA